MQTIRQNLTPARLMVLGFTLVYTLAAGIYFSSIGNTEFLGYVAILLVLIVFGGCMLAHQCAPAWLLWLLSITGILHILGAGVMVDGDVLYNYIPFPIENAAELSIIKFDQLVHAYSSGVGAVLLYFFLARDTSFRWFGIATFAILGSLGIGAINEILEFSAKLSFTHTNVGGYYNTAVDLCANLIGAVIGTLLAFAAKFQVGPRTGEGGNLGPA